MACQEIISGRLALATYPLWIPSTRLLASGETSNWAELSRYGSFYNAPSGISEGSAEGRASIPV